MKSRELKPRNQSKSRILYDSFVNTYSDRDISPWEKLMQKHVESLNKVYGTPIKTELKETK